MTILTHMELMESIQKYLNIKWSDLLMTEQRLYLNITRGIQWAHTNTLSIWLHLISTEREATIPRK